MPRVIFLLLALFSLMAGSARAQFLILKDGSRIPSSEFHVENGKIIRTILLGDNKTATTELPKQNVGSLDWPDVVDIT